MATMVVSTAEVSGTSVVLAAVDARASVVSAAAVVLAAVDAGAACGKC